MKETRKRPESDPAAGEVAGKRTRVSPESEDGGEEEEEEFVDEETVTEVMKLLEEELLRPTNNGFGLADEMIKGPPLMSSGSSSSCLCSSFVTESCGASFSESGSTVMADVDVSGISISFDQLAGIHEWTATMVSKAAEKEEEWSSPEMEDGSRAGGEIINGCGGGRGSDGDDDDDEEWMERVLSLV